MLSISVIIPSYNRIDYLRECLDSVFAQRFLPSEVIVVDDGSIDGTVEMLAADPRVTLLQQANSGPGVARNRGAAAARGDYLAFLDSDDLWFPWSLQSISNLIILYGKPALLFGRFEDFTGDAPFSTQDLIPKGRFFSDYFESAREGYFAGAGMMVIQRSVFEAIGGFREERINAEDHDLALRLGTAPGFVQVCAPLTVAHRMHGENEMGDLDRNLAGLRRLVATERQGGYPGGVARMLARRSIISSHVRSAVVGASRSGHFREVTDLYRDTFWWNLRAGRIVYLIGPLFFAFRAHIQARGINI